MVLFVAQSAFGQVIRINKEAAVESRQDVRLGDLATVSRTDARTAEHLANIVILPEAKESRSLRAEAVLMAVLAQVGPGKLADKLEIAGAAVCELRIKQKPARVETVPLAAEKTIVEPTVQLVEMRPLQAAKSEPTLSRLVIEEIERSLAASTDDLRISFTTVNPLLDAPTPEGKRWVVRPLTRTFLGSVQFEVQLVEGFRVAQKFNVQAQVLKRERVLLVASPLSRGDLVTRAHIRTQETWMDRQMPTLLLQEKEVIGLEALRPVAVGSLVDQRDFKAVEMAVRGESLSVVFVQGNLKVQMKATAMQGGKLHDSIKVKSDSDETYQATLIGKRLAVVGQVNDKQELREAR